MDKSEKIKNLLILERLLKLLNRQHISYSYIKFYVGKISFQSIKNQYNDDIESIYFNVYISKQKIFIDNKRVTWKNLKNHLKNL